MMKKCFYILPIILLAMSVLSGCTDGDDDKKPNVKEVLDSDMVKYGWKWVVSLDNDLRMCCSPDVSNGGFFMQVDDMDGYDAIFVFDDKCRISEACINNVWYYFFFQGNTLNMSYIDGIWTHASFDFNSVKSGEGNSFEKIAANLKAVFQTIGYLPKPTATNLNDLFACVESGMYNTSSAADGDANMQSFCNSVYFYESFNQTLRQELFDTDMFVHYAHDRTPDSNQIGIMASPIYNSTFNRGYGAGSYGMEMENRVYCGLVFGSSPEVTLENSEHTSKLVPLEPVDNYVWVDVPENLENKTYYVRAFMVSEQEKEKVERGEYIHPHLIRYEEGIPNGMELFYGGEMRLDNFSTYNESVINRVLTVGLSGDLSLPGNLSDALQGMALEMKVRPVGTKENASVGMVDPGRIEKFFQVWKRDFKELDTENFVARGDWQLSVYAGWVCIGVVPFTVVYDRKPSIRYEDLTSDGTTVTYKSIFDGALWFDDNVLGMWDCTSGPVEFTSAFAIDGETENSMLIDDTDKITYKMQAANQYMITTVNGKEMKSNRLIFERNADGKRTNVYLEK